MSEENQALEVRGGTLLEVALAMTITNEDEKNRAGHHLGLLKDYEKAVKAYNKPIKSTTKKAHTMACDQEKKMLVPVTEGKPHLNQILGAWDDEVRERERQARAAEAELVFKEQQERKKEEEAKALESARCLEAMGDTNASEKTLSHAADKIAANEEQAKAEAQALMNKKSEIPKTSGVSIRTNWKHEVEDANEVPREWLIPDEKAIGAYVRKHKEKAKIPGVKTWPVRGGY